ncbi:MAG: hypothetical protein AAF170_03795 [Bacteroidota bacterium]
MPTTATKPRKKSGAKKKSTSSSRPRPSSRLAARKAGAMPGWKDLDKGGRTKKSASSRKKASKKKTLSKKGLRPLDAVPSLKTGLLALFAFVAVVAFVNHVYGTRATLDELQDARKENERLRLTHQRLQGDVDRMTSPEAVMPRAAALGLEESVAYGPTVVVADN